MRDNSAAKQVRSGADAATLLVRLRNMLSEEEDVREQKMFGSVCFMVSGNMLVGASGRGLLVRVGKEGHESVAREPHASAMQMGHRTMQGYVLVSLEGIASDADLANWLRRAKAYVDTLPPKQRPPAAAAR